MACCARWPWPRWRARRTRPSPRSWAWRGSPSGGSWRAAGTSWKNVCNRDGNGARIGSMQTEALTPWESAQMDPSQFRRIDAVCDAFEAQLRAGKRPAIEEQLLLVPEQDRERLRGELLRLQEHYLKGKQQAGPAESTTEQSLQRAAPHPHQPAPGADAPDRIPPPLPGYEEVAGPSLGGMGAVWRGRDARLRQWVAVKVLKANLRSWPELRRRFTTEAQLTSQLQHPNIPPVHDLGQLPDGRPYYCMKWVQGRTLAALLAEVPAEQRVTRLLPVFQQVCE